VIGAFTEDHSIRAILGKGYYAFLDMGPWVDRAGLSGGAELGAILAERFGLAVVPGSYFSEYGARWIRFSYALPPEITKAATERLWEALSSL
jgi:aspartate/methionine/tyrosine aminotransferase